MPRRDRARVDVMLPYEPDEEMFDYLWARIRLFILRLFLKQLSTRPAVSVRTALDPGKPPALRCPEELKDRIFVLQRRVMVAQREIVLVEAALRAVKSTA